MPKPWRQHAVRRLIGTPLFVIQERSSLSCNNAFARENPMMSTPEVTYSRPVHPDKQVRPPPKSFAEFQNEAKPSLLDGTKGTYNPPKPSSPDALELTQTEQRLGLLEQRIEAVEAELEDLTDAATKPTNSPSASFIAHLVRLTVVDGLVSPEAALLAIARELGLVDVTTKLATPSPHFRAPSPLPAVAPPVTRAAEPAQVTHYEPVPPPETEKRPGRTGRVRSSEQDAARQEVKALMENHELSQNRVAASAGITQTALSRWLRGYDSKDPALPKRVAKAIVKLV
jgi:DNA-binding transcriptional regulator YiaG